MTSGTLAAVLKQKIEQVTADLRASTPMAEIARAGRFPPRALAFYLESLRFMFEQSQQNLASASLVSEARGESGLAEYFTRKRAEEDGHDAWARHDLSLLPGTATQHIQPALAVVRLTELQRTLLAKHGMLFVAYVLWAEYFTALVGDEWLEALAHSGYRRDQLSAVTEHVALDGAHALDGFAALETLWRGEPSAFELCAAVDQAAHEFKLFCDEVCSVAAHS